MNAPKTLKPALESASTRTRLSPLEPLRHPQYAACWTTGILAHGAAWMQALTVPFLVYEMTESATWLGAAAVAYGVVEALSPSGARLRLRNAAGGRKP